MSLHLFFSFLYLKDKVFHDSQWYILKPPTYSCTRLSLGKIIFRFRLVSSTELWNKQDSNRRNEYKWQNCLLAGLSGSRRTKLCWWHHKLKEKKSSSRAILQYVTSHKNYSTLWPGRASWGKMSQGISPRKQTFAERYFKACRLLKGINGNSPSTQVRGNGLGRLCSINMMEYSMVTRKDS